jgi:hypothetical protein
VNLQEIGSLGSSSKLSHCLNKGHALNISDCTTQLDYAYVWLLICIVDGYFGNSLDPVNDGICDVWNDLYGLAEIVAFSLALNNVFVDLASCDIVLASQSDVQVSFVVAQVEVDFSAVVKYKDLPMSVI